MAFRFLVSILTHRKESGVERCMDSVLASNGRFGLYLVANGPSASEYFREVARKNANRISVHVVENEINRGFIPPNNTAFQYAHQMGYDVFVMLNDDTTVPPNWLARIEAEFERHPAAAIVGPQDTCRTLNPNGHGYQGDRLDYIDGACCAVRVKYVAKHFRTLFDEELQFAYGEDSSLSLRMRKLGYTIHQANFRIQHNRGSTAPFVVEVRKWQAHNHEVLKTKYGHYLKCGSFPRRIVVRRMGGLGDVVLVTPIIRALWHQNPLSEIWVETGTPELFAGNPYCTGAKRSIPFWPEDHFINLDMTSENGCMRHFVTSYARAAGVGEIDQTTELYWEHDRFANEDWSNRWCAMHIGPTWTAKQWPIERFAEVSAWLRSAGWKIVLVGTGDKPEALPYDSDLRNRTHVHELAPLLSHCRLFVGVDGFCMHVAGAVGIPTVGIFGITESRFVMSGRGPQIGCDADPVMAPRAGERHRVSNANYIEEDGSCIRTVTVDQVKEAILKIT